MVVVSLTAASETTDRRLRRSPSVLYSSELPAMGATLQAAADAGIRRVVLASSNQVMAGYEGDHPYSAILAGHYEGLDPGTIRRLTVDDPPRPVMPYDVGKLAAEALGRQYSERGLSVVCLRLGSITRSGRPESARHFASLLTHRDLLRVVEAAIDASDDLRFGVFLPADEATELLRESFRPEPSNPDN